MLLLCMMERMASPERSPIETTIELFDQLRAPLLRYLLSLHLAMPDAEEIVQEVFLALYQHLKKGQHVKRGEPDSNLRAWAFTVAHHQALRSRLRSQRVAVLPADTIDESPDPEEIFADHQRQMHLQAVVRALPAQDQCCLGLRAEGLRYREIAAVLGVSLGTVANSIERAIARLTRADRRTYASRG
jgi:RNA polymerase sigma-70 factor (ECF subfamily)